MFNPTKSLLISKFVLFKPNVSLLGKLKLAVECKRCYSLLNTPLKLKVRDISLNKYVMHLEQEYGQLNACISNIQPQQLNRLRELEPIMKILKNRSDILKDLENLNELLNDEDSEIKRLAKEEKIIYEHKVEEIESELLEAVLPVDDYDTRSSIMVEVNAGVGGQEAMLFAKELFYMYCSFAQHKKWNVEVAGYLSSDSGGIRHAVALIKGKNAFRYFKFEGGVHRVQRVPATEKMGRVHTSTVSVIVLPEPTEIEVVIDSKDLRIETKRASGAGGQHVNTTDSAVRITHIPTGITAECQEDRSQIKNKKVAMYKLRSMLYERQLKQQNDEIESTRKNQVNSNFRNEKIRTYNFSQDRITDHRLHNSNVHNLRSFLTGGEALEGLMNKLNQNSRIDRLLEYLIQLNCQ